LIIVNDDLFSGISKWWPFFRDDERELLRTFTWGGLAFPTDFKGRFDGWSTGRTDSTGRTGRTRRTRRTRRTDCDKLPPFKVGEFDDDLLSKRWGGNGFKGWGGNGKRECNGKKECNGLGFKWGGNGLKRGGNGLGSKRGGNGINLTFFLRTDKRSSDLLDILDVLDILDILDVFGLLVLLVLLVILVSLFILFSIPISIFFSICIIIYINIIKKYREILLNIIIIYNK